MARKYPGIKIVCVAPYDYYFDESVWPTWAKVLPFDDPLVTKFNSKERSIKLANGSSIRFHAYDDPEKIKGWEAHIIWIEEASELGDGNTQKAMQIFRALLMRLRAKPASIPRRVYVSQNPKGHNWTWRVFVKDSPHQDDPILTHIPPNADYPKGMTYREFVKEAPNGNDVYYTISAGSTANVTLPTGYVDTMLDNMTDDPLLRNRMVEGGFDPIHSLVYDWPYYSKKTHVVDLETVLRVQGWDFTDERQIPRYLPLFIGIDTAGPNSPWAIEAFVQVPEPYEHMLGIGEVYTKGDTWREIVEKLQALTEGWTNISYFVDPKTANKKEGPNQTSILEFFHQWGIPATTPRLGANKGAVIAHVRNLLKPDPNFEHPYLTDFWDEEKQGYNLGAPRLLYLRDPSYAFTVVRDGKVMVDNSEGIANFFNLKEKEVWRFDGKKPRETKEHEEGLSPQANEKTVDRDDHAQDAEGFTMVGWLPLPVSRTRSKRDRDWDNVPVNRYPAQKRRAGRFGV